MKSCLTSAADFEEELEDDKEAPQSRTIGKDTLESAPKRSRRDHGVDSFSSSTVRATPRDVMRAMSILVPLQRLRCGVRDRDPRRIVHDTMCAPSHYLKS